jgi:hypothetical protein
MSFTNPLMLIGLAAILVPIIIHLFNFRRYKTIRFSNVQMLEDIQKKTKRASQVQQLIILALRVLGIACLVLAAAQPFMRGSDKSAKSGNVVSLFVDNSYSMETESQNGSRLYDAVDAAKNIVQTFDFSDDFVLTTQDFSGEESHILNKDQLLEMLDRIAVSPNSHSFKEIYTFEKHTLQNSQKANVIHYYISDFQKNSFDMSVLRNDSSTHIGLIPTPAAQLSNIGIDSCWFLTPVFRLGNTVTLIARIHNYGTEEAQKVPVKLHVNDKQKAIAAIDIPAGSYSDCHLTYRIDEAGTNCGKVSIEDAPITFDDDLYFTYEVSDNSTISVIYDKEPNRFLAALYGKDSVFIYQPMGYQQINYTQLRQSNVIVLNGIPSVSSGLADELTKFVKAGGTLLVFPSEKADNSVNALLQSLGAGTFGSLVKKSLKCKMLNSESVYFKGALETQDARVDMPQTLQHFAISGGGNGSETIMVLEDNTPLLISYPTESGEVILSAVALNDDYGNAHRHALFFVPLHNIGIMNAVQQKLYNLIGIDQMQRVMLPTDRSDEAVVLRARKGSEEFIPEQRRLGNETALFFHNQAHTSDWYDIMRGGQTLGTIAFNLNRRESDLTCYDESELKKMADDLDGDVAVVSANTKNIAKSVNDRLNGKPLWPWFILLSLLCFLAEIALLRFWGKPALNEE